MRCISEDELDKIKERKLLIIGEIRQDLEMILKHTVKSGDKGHLTKLMGDSGIKFVSSMDDLIDVLEERKDSKYAALTVELGAVMEAFLQEVYKASNNQGRKYNTRNKPSNRSITEVIEHNLGNHVYIGNRGNLELLNKIRNKIIHNNDFSFRQAKKERSIVEVIDQRKLQKGKKLKSKDILLQLINDSEEYVRGVKSNW